MGVIRHGHNKHEALPYSFNPSTEIFHHIQARQYGRRNRSAQLLVNNFVSKQLPGLLREREYDLGQINKIFASMWVSDRQVVLGSKCNKLIVMDLITKQMAPIPSLQSSDEHQPAICPCGIHAIAVNPSKSLLATGGENTNDLAVYKLPTFDPVCVGENGHSDWIFDIKWLDDQFACTGSRDGNLALWKVDEDLETSATTRMKCLQVPEYQIINPTVKVSCRKAEKVRALTFNNNTREIAALSLNAYLHLFDAKTFTQKSSRKLQYNRENVCLTLHEDRGVYAVGSQSYVTLLDQRSPKENRYIQSLQRGCGIRSLTFNDDMLSIGTGAGNIYFYDLRAGRNLELHCGHPCQLKVGKGWLLHDDTYQQYFMNHEYPNAIYTHCYNDSGTKLFAAGGPLPAGLWGNYAGLWQ